LKTENRKLKFFSLFPRQQQLPKIIIFKTNYLFIYLFFCVCADAFFTTRMRSLPRPQVKPRLRVNADVGGRPNEKDFGTDIFIQKRPL
jgi:hypothetical protein